MNQHIRGSLTQTRLEVASPDWFKEMTKRSAELKVFLLAMRLKVLKNRQPTFTNYSLAPLWI